MLHPSNNSAAFMQVNLVNQTNDPTIRQFGSTTAAHQPSINDADSFATSVVTLLDTKSNSQHHFGGRHNPSNFQNPSVVGITIKNENFNTFSSLLTARCSRHTLLNMKLVILKEHSNCREGINGNVSHPSERA